MLRQFWLGVATAGAAAVGLCGTTAIRGELYSHLQPPSQEEEDEGSGGGGGRADARLGGEVLKTAGRKKQKKKKTKKIACNANIAGIVDTACGPFASHRGPHALLAMIAAAGVALDVKVILIPPCIFH
jgi:hypothetical protein